MLAASAIHDTVTSNSVLGSSSNSIQIRFQTHGLTSRAIGAQRSRSAKQAVQMFFHPPPLSAISRSHNSRPCRSQFSPHGSAQACVKYAACNLRRSIQHCGQKPVRAAIGKGSTGVRYERSLSDRLTASAGVDWRYTGSRYVDFSTNERQRMPSYNILDMRLGSTRGLWSVTLYAKNVATELAID